MGTRDRYAEGIPCWVDLATPDMESAKAYYSALFGWEYVDAGPEDMPYSMAMQKGLPAAGIGPSKDTGRPSWTSYFAVDDIEASLSKVVDAGGDVVFGPDRAADLGILAICSDPTGAVFGMWQPGSHHGAGIVNEHGTLNWNELTCDDLSQAIPFYAAVFGHDAETDESRNYTVFSVGGRPIAGAMPPPVAEIPNHWGVYFAVDDLDSARSAAEDAGAALIFERMEIPDVGYFLGLKHEAGGTITLIQLASPVD